MALTKQITYETVSSGVEVEATKVIVPQQFV